MSWMDYDTVRQRVLKVLEFSPGFFSSVLRLVIVLALQ